ncbi:Mss4-like protein [Corynascus novoguineensis]|uniref:Mss4-like protein n=1 Tax=Corynascus novoguineensis TaxID=1126955 RepID=A0AAN7CMZ5_9PEZI|nr:Mss4-like protein [Corynascus novoguineensis]
MGSDGKNIVSGSCLCGKIRFEMALNNENNCLCFCNSCRKITGSVGMANTWCKQEELKFLTPASNMTIFEDKSPDSGGTIHRGFCGTCGSTMISENKKLFPGNWIVPVGALEFDPLATDWTPRTEFFCKRKMPWFSTPADTVKYHELFPIDDGDA